MLVTSGDIMPILDAAGPSADLRQHEQQAQQEEQQHLEQQQAAEHEPAELERPRPAAAPPPVALFALLQHEQRAPGKSSQEPEPAGQLHAAEQQCKGKEKEHLLREYQ